jgi:ankyrin repeat protein
MESGNRARHLDAAEPDGRTPLHRAIDSAADDAARRLVEAGADVNEPDRWGNTPLWRAIYNAPLTMDIASLLLDHGADPNTKNHRDVSPLDLARKMADDYREVAQFLPKLHAARLDDGGAPTGH